MNPQNRATILLAWLMFIMGGAALAVSLILPPWIEARELRREQVEARRRIGELEKQVKRVSRQIDHMQNDPAYLERIGREEFGIETPGVEVVPVAVAAAPEESPDATADPDGGFSASLERAAHENPLVSVFVLDQSRPVVLGMSGVLVAAAIVMLASGGGTPAGTRRKP